MRLYLLAGSRRRVLQHQNSIPGGLQCDDIHIYVGTLGLGTDRQLLCVLVFGSERRRVYVRDCHLHVTFAINSGISGAGVIELYYRPS